MEADPGFRPRHPANLCQPSVTGKEGGSHTDMPGRRTKPVWRLFTENHPDYSKVDCLVPGCNKTISRGKTGSKRSELNSNSMDTHIRTSHPEQWEEIKLEEKEAAKEAKETVEKEAKKDETLKGSNKIWHLNNMASRLNFFNRVGFSFPPRDIPILLDIFALWCISNKARCPRCVLA